MSNIKQIRREEDERLRALEKQNPAYKKQWEKYRNKELSEQKPVAKVNRENQREPVGGKKGCSSCAKRGLMSILKGGAKLLKAELGMDAADEATKAKRKALCLGCSNYDFGICREFDDDGKDIGGCGCICAYKVLLAGEECPRGKW
jgi:5,10-methylene-tetrahydrofolate dehydrogenase/methenyl tetrahydrofolate cyclohydrolase